MCPPLANAPRQPGTFCLLGPQSHLPDVLVACCETNPPSLLTESPYVTDAQLLRVGNREAGGLSLLHHIQVTWGHVHASSLPSGPSWEDSEQVRGK